jgi:HK97 family phage portal protein
LPDASHQRPGFVARAAASFLSFLEKKAAPAISFRHPTYGGGSLPYWGDGSAVFSIGALPGDDRDAAADAGDLWLNSVVSACVFWLSDQFGEPELRVTSLDKSTGEYEPFNVHELVDLLEFPNDGYGADALWAATVLSYQISGNAYWIKARSKSGEVVQVWHASPWEIEEVWPDDGSAFLTGYRHVVDGSKYDLAREDVVHFRRGLDPTNPRRGLSPLAAVLREVATDNAASAYEAAVLRNMGIVPTHVQPAELGDSFGAGEAGILKEQFQGETTGSNRGRVVVTDARIDIKQYGLSPQDMALGTVRHAPVSRICAATGVNAQVLGLSEGTPHNTYENQAAAVRGAYARGLVPMQRSFARTLTRSLLWPDFDGRPGMDYCEWCYDEVAALNEDANDVANRAVLLFKERVIKRGKACEMIGVEPPDPEYDVYLEQPAAESARAWAAVDDNPDTDPNAFGKPGGPPSQLKPKEPAGDDDEEEDEEVTPGRMRIAKAVRALANGHAAHGPEGEHRDPFPREGKATPPAEPEEDDDEDDSEENTYGLPAGRPIESTLRTFFNRQMKETLGTTRTIGESLDNPIPPPMPDLTAWDGRMTRAITPLISAYWDEAGQRQFAKLGLDPAAWEVVDPNTRRMIEGAALALSKSTNETTTKDVRTAIEQLRSELIAGIVDKGESVAQLRKRVQGVFENADKVRAARIAQTEASRAVHQAQLESARRSGVVCGKKLLVSTDACSICQTIGADQPDVGFSLDGEMYNDGRGHPDYSSVTAPPIHPGCRCAMEAVVCSEIGLPDPGDA